METLIYALAIVLVSGNPTIVSGPLFETKAECVQEVQENGYQAVKATGHAEAKIYCVDPKDYPGLKSNEPDKLKQEDFVPEK